MNDRVGTGFDVHALVESKPLWIGGIKIPHNKGLEGHSDGDVLIHAIVDALFGAMGVGDLGDHFPSSDQRWRGAKSSGFLTYAKDLMSQKFFEFVYLDSVIMAQNPILKPFVLPIRENLAQALDCSIDQVSVKATTTDHLGFLGREEGMAAQAICLLRSSRAK
jgi:2-C-methyl-D-erythritol 2,4-cyclodiphosphate synthase